MTACEVHPFAPGPVRCAACQRASCAGCLFHVGAGTAGPTCLPCALRARQAGRQGPAQVLDLRSH